MFDLFRSREKSVRILLGVLLLLVAGSMLIYLVPSGSGIDGANGANIVAEVGSEKITSEDVMRGLQQLRQNRIPDSQMAAFIPQIVDSLVADRAMALKAKDLGITVTDQEVADFIQAQLGNGQPMDAAAEQAQAASRNMTVPQFEQAVRSYYLNNRLQALTVQSAMISTEEAKSTFHKTNDQVSLDWVKFDQQDFASKVDKSPAAIQAWFAKNRGSFMVPERRTFGLISGSSADFIASAQIPEATLHQMYAESLDSFRTPERVNARHILVMTQGKPKEDANKLKAKAEDLLAQLKKGADFAELAKKDSDDPGSGQKGGELGWLTRGQTDPQFEAAAFALKPGETSGIVTSQFGYHIIQVNSHEAARVRPFEEVRPELLAEAQKESGDKALEAAITAARVEIAKNPAQAAAIAQKHNLKYNLVEKAPNTGALPDLGPQPELSSAIYSATPKGGITNITDIAKAGKMAFAVVTDVVPTQPGEFKDVELDVINRHTAEAASRIVRDVAAQALKLVKDGQSLDAVAKELNGKVGSSAPFSRTGTAEGLGPASFVQQAFTKKPGDIVGPVTSGTGTYVVRVKELIPANDANFEKQRDSIVKSLEQQQGQTVDALYRDSVVEEMRRKGKVKFNQPVINRIMASFKS